LEGYLSMQDLARIMLISALTALSAVLVTFSPGSAWADAKTCAASHASGQREVKAGRLRLASELFTTCGSDESCPDQIRTECTEFLESVRQTIPTVILSVVDDAGSDVSNVRVYSTDELLTEQLDGRAIELDPGKHRLRFVLPWGDVLSSDVLIREGEKNRLVEVRLPKKGGASSPDAAEPAAEPSAPSKPAETRSTPVAAYLATGLAVVGFGTFAGFAIAGNSEKNQLESCAPSCGDGDRNRYEDMKRSYVIADVGLGVGAVSTVVAAVLFVTSGQSSSERTQAARNGKPRAGLKLGAPRGGASIALAGQF
jgi:hypothetical protein